jgi:CheY-like chemotaxis protein
MLNGSDPKTVVLVVEDEALLRMDAVDTIREAGFAVVEAADADAAIALIEGGNDIALVFTDLQLPGSMDGLTLAAAIKQRWPALKVIATSGDHDGGSAGRLPTGEPLLVKPYSNETLKRTIREAIDAG